MDEEAIVPKSEVVSTNRSESKIVDMDGSWVEETNDVEDIRLRNLTQTVVVHKEDGTPKLDSAGNAVLATVPVTTKRTHKRKEYFEEEVEVDDGEIHHSYSIDSVPENLTPPDNAKREWIERKRLNPKFQPELNYTPRELRREWAIVSMLGQEFIRVGCPKNDRWMKMRSSSDNVEEWLVRP